MSNQSPAALRKEIDSMVAKAIDEAIAARKGVVSVGGSLSLIVRGGSALWRYRFRDGQTERTKALGTYPEMSLYAARKARNSPTARVGKAATKTADPLPAATGDAREKFGEVLTAYLAEAGPEWGQHEQTDFRNMMDKAPKLLALAVDDVKPLAIAEAVQAAYPDKPKRQAKFRRRIAAVMTFAETRHVKTKLEVIHHPAMKLAEVPALMTELAALDSADARALRFAILSAARSGEALQADWKEITEIDGVPTWVHDRAHRKGGKNATRKLHYVPLTRQMLDALGPRGEGLIFRSRITGGKLGHSVMSDLLATLRPAVDEKGKPLCSVHGMRSTFRDWVTDKTDFDGDLGELALAHTIGNKSKQAYARSDALLKRLPMMQAWGDLIAR